MLKKIVVPLLLGVYCSCSVNAQLEFRAARSENLVYRNLTVSKQISERLDGVMTSLTNQVEAKVIYNAQTMYDYLKNNTRAEKNADIMDMYNVLISYLRVQDNDIAVDKLLSSIQKTVDALKWMVNAATTNVPKHSFYKQTSNILHLLKPQVFIHLEREHMEFCVAFAKKMQAAMKIDAIDDNINPEDGAAFSDILFVQELEHAQHIISECNKLEGDLNSFDDNLDGISKEEISMRIEKLHGAINELKNAYVIVGADKIRVSKNIVQHLRKVGGAVMSKLQQKWMTK